MYAKKIKKMKIWVNKAIFDIFQWRSHSVCFCLIFEVRARQMLDGFDSFLLKKR